MKKKKVYTKPQVKTEKIVLGVFGNYNQGEGKKTGIGNFLAAWGK